MVSAVNHFVKEHTPALRVLAVNILGLAEVPITNGTVEASAWHQLTGNRQLVIYLTCTTTPLHPSHIVTTSWKSFMLVSNPSRF
jgi:hypothetical protein